MEVESNRAGSDIATRFRRAVRHGKWWGYVILLLGHWEGHGEFWGFSPWPFVYPDETD
jgi:hypothetical protein